MTLRQAMARDGVVVACAISAGIHAAITPEHLREEPSLGVAFAASAGVLGALAAVLASSSSRAALVGAAATFSALLGGYALAVTTGIPLLLPEREAVDGLALVTKAVEAGGLVAAIALLRAPRGRTARIPQGTKGAHA